MSHFCSGKTHRKTKCKNKVIIAGTYCEHHVDQKKEGSNCKCWLDSGDQCQFKAEETGFCEFHIAPTVCLSKLATGLPCSRWIVSGKQCQRCRHENGPVLDSVKESAENLRSMLMKQHGDIIVPHAKIVSVSNCKLTDEIIGKLVIPASLKANTVDKPEDCLICIEPMTTTEHRRLQCGHYFHTECISKIFARTCPMCRKDIDPSFLPKWVNERITENIERHEEEQDLETRAFVIAMQNQELQEYYDELTEEDQEEEDDYWT